MTTVPGGYRVDVRAESFAHDIALLADKVAPDAVVDDMLVSLGAGESCSFLVRTATVLSTPSDLASPRVLRSANTLCAPHCSGRVRRWIAWPVDGDRSKQGRCTSQ